MTRQSVAAIAALVLFCACTSLADDATPNTVSRPAGFVRIHLPSNNHTLVAFPFDVLDNSVNAILSGQLSGGITLDDGDTLLKWDPAKPGYNMAVKIDGTGNPDIDGKWFADPGGEPSDMTLVPGEGFFILNRQPTDQILFLKGNLALSPSNTTALLPTLNLIGSPFSTSINITNTAIWEAWDKEGQGADDIPSDEIVDPTKQIDLTMEIALGKGYWYNRKQEDALLWTEVRPYADLFPQNDEPPLIKAVDVVDAGAAIKLTINTTGQAGELLDILYKDVASTGAVTTAGAWKIAATDLPVNGASTVTWTDAGNHQRPKVNEVYGRYYLIGRGDLDLDGDGVADARETFVAESALVERINDMATLGERESTSSTNAVVLPAGESNTVSVIDQAMFTSRIIYVDRRVGLDRFSGRRAIVVDEDGPKQTIQAGLSASRAGDTLIIKRGRYGEDLNVAGRDISVRFSGDVKLSGSAAPIAAVAPSDGSTILTNTVNGAGVSTNATSFRP